MGIRAFIEIDRIDYKKPYSKDYILDFLLQTEQYYIRSFLISLRKEEYYTFIKPNLFLKYFYKRRKNILGRKLGIIIHAGNFAKGLKLYHYGSIIVHPDARIGENCTIHGNCCIGSKGGYPDYAPKIGDNVDIGQASQILGNVSIANGVKIGAGSIVTKSVLEEQVTVVGIPGRIIK